MPPPGVAIKPTNSSFSISSLRRNGSSCIFPQTLPLAQKRQGSFYRALPSGRLGCGLRFSRRGCRGRDGSSRRGQLRGCQYGHCRRRRWGNCGAAGAASGAVIADAVAGATAGLPVRSLPAQQLGQIPQGLQEARHLPPGSLQKSLPADVRQSWL